MHCYGGPYLVEPVESMLLYQPINKLKGSEKKQGWVVEPTHEIHN